MPTMPKNTKLSSIKEISVMSSSSPTLRAQSAMTRIALLAICLLALVASAISPFSIGTISPSCTFHLTRLIYPPAPPLENTHLSPS